MANRRTLKKNIQFITSELVTESYIKHLMLKKMDTESFNSILKKIADLNNDFLSRVNHPNGTKEPKLVKAYYKKLIADFNKEVDQIVEELNK
ncbi:MAG TPA: hypothetical protein P5564_06735 [Paludibacteraceae bacterium]|nr:hypothetical protein [Paludibacteraceae bacterium]HRS68286.1 hypothetical protein [Paludibacteraceae bacterium]